jgi:tight adherence protein B
MFLFVVYGVRARALRPTESRIKRLSASRNVTTTSVDSGNFLKRGPSSIPAISRWLSAGGYAEKWTFQLERADLTLRPGEYFMLRLLVGVTVGVAVALIGRNAFFAFLAIPAAGVGYMIPAFWVSRRISRRVSRINNQLGETVLLIANGVRAGFAFGQSVDAAAKRIGPPISIEFNRMLLDVNLGGSMEESLAAMNERVGSDDMDMLVTAILIQRSSGGNLAEILESIGETISERERIFGEIKTLTSSQRLTGWILSLWPATLALGFFLIAPSVMSLLWTTSAGLVLMAIWLVLNLLGIFSIRRILSIDV